VVELGEFGLWWRRNDMIGSMTEIVYDMLADALVLGESGGKKSSMMMLTVMVVASVLCG
jgi:hypothetical protein